MTGASGDWKLARRGFPRVEHAHFDFSAGAPGAFPFRREALSLNIRNMIP